MRKLYQHLLPLLVFSLAPAIASAQSFRVQCPTSTITHPNAANNNAEPAYKGPTQFTTQPVSGTSGGYFAPTSTTVNGAIRCQQISGGDGYMTEADGTQTFMFAFGPLSGLADVAAGLPSSQFPNVFNGLYSGATPLQRGDPATTDGAASGASPGAPGAFTFNGAVGLTPEVVNTVSVTDAVYGPLPAPAVTPLCAQSATTATIFTDAALGLAAGDKVFIKNVGGGFDNTATNPSWTITCVDNGNGGVTGGVTDKVVDPTGMVSQAFTFTSSTALTTTTGISNPASASSLPQVDGHVEVRPIMDIGVMNGNIPAPLAAFDEDDEFFLTLTNVGMIMRPDLFEEHTVHFHGYPNASSFYDGVPDASVAINIGASFTYYYLAPDAGTYFWHCHITPPEHLQMGMVGQLHVRPRQDRVPAGGSLYTYLGYQNGISEPTPAGATAPLTPDLRTACNPGRDILCSATTPAVQNTVTLARSATTPTSGVQGLDLLGNPQRYTYNDGDGSTAYDVEYPIQEHGFDPNFHFVGMTFNPEMFADMKDKYFLLNGRGYPDTVAAGPQATASSDGQLHYSQPLPAIINIPVGGKALLRLVNLSVTEYHTLQSVGIPMLEVGFMAKLLRDQAGNNTEFYTNSVTLGGGESLDVILDASDAGCSAFAGAGCSAKLYPAGSVFYLNTPQLDHLSNDAENFGGMMTEVHICNSVSGGNTFGNVCN